MIIPASHPVPRLQRTLELLLLYGTAPGLMAFFSGSHRWVGLPAILLGSLVSFALLWFDETWQRRRFFDLGSSRTGLRPVLFRAALLLLLLLALLYATGHPPSFRISRERPLVWLGGLSYSLYLWQQPFLNRASPGPLTQFPQNLVFAVACAILSYRLIEQPFLTLRVRVERWLLPPRVAGS